jgi:hypothetical protein
MSADNWAICPKCKKLADSEHEQFLNKMKSGYGKIPPEEYLEMVEKSKKPILLDQTLREDFGLGVDDVGNFFVSYGCSCECGFKFRYDHKQKVL